MSQVSKQNWRSCQVVHQLHRQCPVAVALGGGDDDSFRVLLPVGDVVEQCFR